MNTILNLKSHTFHFTRKSTLCVCGFCLRCAGAPTFLPLLSRPDADKETLTAHFLVNKTKHVYLIRFHSLLALQCVGLGRGPRVPPSEPKPTVSHESYCVLSLQSGRSGEGTESSALLAKSYSEAVLPKNPNPKTLSFGLGLCRALGET